jgi:hypothetical protein
MSAFGMLPDRLPRTQTSPTEATMRRRSGARCGFSFYSSISSPEVNVPTSRTFEHCRECVHAGAEVTVARAKRGAADVRLVSRAGLERVPLSSLDSQGWPTWAHPVEPPAAPRSAPMEMGGLADSQEARRVGRMAMIVAQIARAPEAKWS